MLGDFDLAEEVVQDSIVAALEKWPAQGIPDNPGAWLMTTAKRRAIDILRRSQRHQEKIALLSFGNSLMATPHGDGVWLFGLNGKKGPAAAPGKGSGTQHAGETTGGTSTVVESSSSRPLMIR